MKLSKKFNKYQRTIFLRQRINLIQEGSPKIEIFCYFSWAKVASITVPVRPLV